MNIYFAPIQGYTEDLYRRIHHELFGGVEEYYTPFVRLEHGDLRQKDVRDVKPEYNADVPLVPQIIASDGKEASVLIEYIKSLGYSRIDVNMGCPFPLQTRHGRGAGLLQHPDKAEEVCKVMAEHADVQFSVKMRLGMEASDEWQSILPMFAQLPLQHVTMHPRLARQQYKGDVDMNAFADFMKACPLPVIYNGDVISTEQIEQIAARWPQLKGIMIGRGLLARPSLAIEHRQQTAMAEPQLIGKIRQMHSQMLQHYERIIPGEAQRLSKIRTFWDFMEPTIGRKPWKKITKAGNMKNYLAAIAEL